MSALTPRPWLVVDTTVEIASTVTLTLAPADGTMPPPFQPAEFSMLAVPGIGEAPISISSDPAVRDTHAFTVRGTGSVTNALCAKQRGDVIGVRGPFGNSWGCDRAHGNDVVIIGGGIGLAPLRPAVFAIARDRERYGRVALLAGARTQAHLLFSHQFASWRRAGLDLHLAVDRPTPGWHGIVGPVTALLDEVALHWPTATAMVCGPDVMMRAVADALCERGMDADRIRITLERSMQCGIGLCGRCQLGPTMVCRDGPVVSYASVASFYGVPEI
jgi:anaerobic sulfite reductase subunit B